MFVQIGKKKTKKKKLIEKWASNINKQFTDMGTKWPIICKKKKCQFDLTKYKSHINFHLSDWQQFLKDSNTQW